MKKLCALLLLFPALALCLESKKHLIDMHVGECMKKDYSTHNTVKCLNEGAEKWDAELNRAYGTLKGLTDAKGKDRLIKAQRRWVQFRDSQYEFIDCLYSQLSGTMYLEMRAADRLEIVRRRVLELQSHIDLLKP